jgi:predicted helicase
VSHVLIQRYLDDLSDLKRLSGTDRETIVREAFKTLLKGWGRNQDLKFIPEYPLTTSGKDRRYIDGALVDPIRIPFGYWEAKDSKDNLDKEIERKFRRGYPQDNIIFEDSREAILIQNKQLVMRCNVDLVPHLEELLHKFFAYESPATSRFRKAVAQFKIDLPDVLDTLRRMIEAASERNSAFRASAERFLKHARATIHPTVTSADINEMLIQHILTEEIFSKVFDQDEFHRNNNIAKLLYRLEATFFTGDVKWQTLNKLAPYYSAINSAAVEVRGHHEKQTFLKVVYQNFYHVYNEKLADRLGVIYTPNEIVRFIVEGAEWLCQTNFNKRLIDKNVEILEPAAGTGTFVTELIDYFRRQPGRLKEKYLNEIHANEIAILPYYVANLNIEASYAALTREYVEFPNLCFVDTLDSIEGLGRFAGHQAELFGALSEENYDRIRKQNKRKISIVIGNPPYNANQIRENDNNKNRKYPNIDARIKATYLARSTAQKTKLYDPYVRFFRWASDRIHDAGVVAFITNRSYIDARNFDGFRRTVIDEFDEIYVIDLGGDWKKQGVAGGGNVFGIGTGVAVGFWIRRPGKEKKAGRLFYATAPEGSGEEKLAWLASLNDDGRSFGNIQFDEIVPKSGYWVNNPEVEFGSELPVASKDVKLSKRGASDKAIFKLFSLGVSTNRDEWLYDYERSNLRNKVRYLVGTYNGIEPSTKNFPDTLKWSRNLKRRLSQERREPFSERRIVEANYRPFTKVLLYKSDLFVDELGHANEFFPRNEPNTAICFTDPHAQKPWFVCAVNGITDLHYVGAGAGTVCLGRYRFVHGDRIDNITNWTLDQFTRHYHSSSNPLTKDSIFHYVYGVFHDPLYREKYALNLKREYPRVPFYKDFWCWAGWGEELMALHLGYETVDPWPLKRVDVEDQSSRRAGFAPKAILRANKEEGIIRLNGETQLLGVPATAWDYKLGIRSALEWILDQYGESTPRDDVIRERFDCYSFSKHKEQVIDLLCRVTRVSVETQRIVGQMRKLTER